jgi:hypothetical protein
VNPCQSRGYRNRNPGNIEYNPRNKWQGQVGLGDDWLPPEKRRFAKFETHEYGIRALAVLLITYQDRYDLRTIRGIIHRWAPSAENDTLAYIAHVARLTGRDPGETLDLHRYEDLRPLVEAIITHECGGNPYDAATIDAGLRLAGVISTEPSAVLRTGTAKAAAGTAAAGLGGVALTEMVSQVGPWLGGFADLARALGPWVSAALIIAVAAWFVWQRMRRVA